ncbi:MAG: Y-family DNA polymerase [Deltaproteobacteria bacterium]|nr:Y-family DNA polymerase [Deltaproteobacteria bacterium]
MFALADCNNFYASCEKVFNPSIGLRPVVVLSNNDGCVIARSAEAKRLGIPMGAPAFKIEEMIRKYDIAVFSSNFELYGDMSQRVMNILSRFTPDLEIYSIDEAFLSLTGFEHLNLIDYGHKIRETLKQGTGIAVGVGIAPTKTLAKAANVYAKKNGSGVWFVYEKTDIDKLLRWLPISDVWGIGRKHSSRLENAGIKTAYDFVTKMSEEIVLKRMTITGVRTWKELKGIKCIPLEKFPPSKKSIATTRSFGHMVENYDKLIESVTTFASSCASKLRASRLAAGQIMVFIHTNSFRKDLDQYAQNRVLTLPVPTSDSLELIQYAQKALKDIFKEGYQYKKAGVIVSALVNENKIQQDMFDRIDREKHKNLMNAMDEVTKRFGKNSIKIASQGLGKRTWHMNQQNLSKRYTTRWDEIIEVKI